jgi:hypothetical protein
MPAKLEWDFRGINTRRVRKRQFSFGKKYQYFVEIENDSGAPELEIYVASNKKLTPKQGYELWRAWCVKQEAKEKKQGH